VEGLVTFSVSVVCGGARNLLGEGDVCGSVVCCAWFCCLLFMALLCGLVTCSAGVLFVALVSVVCGSDVWARNLLGERAFAEGLATCSASVFVEGLVTCSARVRALTRAKSSARL